MCGPSCTADGIALLGRAHEGAEALLERFGVPVDKALDIEEPRDFDRVVSRLATALRSRVGRSEAAAVRSVVAALDVDWRATTGARRRSLIAHAMTLAGRSTRGVPGQIEATIGRAAEAVVRAVRSRGRRRDGLAIAADFNAIDHRVIAHVRRSQGPFVRQEYVRRAAAFEHRARDTVATALERGLGREDIAIELERLATGVLVTGSTPYWEVVAGTVVSSGRSYAQVSAYAEAGIDRYRVVAVLDRATTPICSFLDGKTFSVATALDRFEAIEQAATIGDLQDAHPWVRVGRDGGKGPQLYVERGGERTTVATGNAGGGFASALNDRDLESLGLGFPPYHGLCRSTTVPA